MHTDSHFFFCCARLMIDSLRISANISGNIVMTSKRNGLSLLVTFWTILGQKLFLKIRVIIRFDGQREFVSSNQHKINVCGTRSILNPGISLPLTPGMPDISAGIFCGTPRRRMLHPTGEKSAAYFSRFGGITLRPEEDKAPRHVTSVARRGYRCRTCQYPLPRRGQFGPGMPMPIKYLGRSAGQKGHHPIQRLVFCALDRLSYAYSAHRVAVEPDVDYFFCGMLAQVSL